MFAAGSLTGIGDLMGGDGITLEEWNFPFTSKNNVLGVNGAQVTGRAICASADGYIDRPHGTLALKGSLVPACGVNSLLSNIPLLGDLLASKQGEGVLSATYSATGNMEHPDISTNPLLDADAGHLPPHVPGPYPDPEGRAVECAGRRRPQAQAQRQAASQLGWLHQDVLFLAAGELRDAVAVECG